MLNAIIQLESPFHDFNRAVDLNRVDSVHIGNFARFGNHFYEVIRALQYCHLFDLRLVYFDPGLLLMNDSLTTDNGITFRPADRHTRETCIMGNFICSPYGFPPLDFTLIEPFKRPYQKKVFPDLQPAGDNDLFIHIRSGDAFVEPSPDAVYAQPPIGYYRDILLKNNWSKVTLLTLDTENPCVNGLLNDTRFHVEWKPRPLIADLRLAFGARNFAIGRGTFGPAVALLSLHLKRLFTFNMSSSLIGPHENCWPEDDYYRGILQGWSHSQEDYRIMMSHGCEHWSYVEAGSDQDTPMHMGMG
jgi:hypothetical protein